MDKNNNRFLLIIILGLLSAIGAFSIDTYLSGFPIMASDLHVSVDDVSYSLSSFFVGISIGQMLYGPLLDRFGRKKPLIVGLVIYVLASMGCAVSTSLEMLVVFRFLQALGGCVGMVTPRAIVRDTFPIQESAKIFSTLILILGVSPIIAPSVGSLMITTMGWHSVFWLQAIIGVVLFLAVLFLLAESKKADDSISLKPEHVTKVFWGIARNPQFITFSVAGSLVSGAIYAYLSGSPFVFMEIFKVSEQQYGIIFGVLAGGLILSSQINNLALRRFSSQQIINVALSIQTILGLLLLTLSAFNLLNLYGTLILIFLFLCCQGFSFPNSSALALMPFSKEAGSASALMGSLQMAIGSLSAAMVGFISNGTSLPMLGVMAGCASLGLIVFKIGNNNIVAKNK
ncbi:drug resistance transporter, Bcr/CflA subfamily [Emticicia oligotrophica DSM 17448]|uniref:Drug resistance transporter, Bcr/CflA subfamily n=1 Tax=Emticicia oligotrophica (strain DSM 17448 / CIP 109782 / MTCC 6937 / GPTSA100-15) TaxID=929562 RepID=A0ABN4AM88_EMTOG|nr:MULTISPECIES: multidrug effflux MFS transporter [Emticicia]AFK03374.1 drug resistance transporter, Bcr/CflA subfamily [Emticicia oligotrophica DSM 17448]